MLNNIGDIQNSLFKQNPMISIIVPVYNAESYLRRCVDSILAQTYTDFELLLIEDGSDDTSGEICEEYASKDNRIRVFHKENGGVSSARNLGIANARGGYITFCDSDDYVGEDWLFEYYKYLSSGHDLYIQGVVKITSNNEKNECVPIKMDGAIDRKYLIASLYELGLLGYVWNKLFSKKIIDLYSLRFDEGSCCGEDLQYVVQYMEYVTSGVCIDECHYMYFLPSSDKVYKGNYYNSFIPIAKSLDKIFQGQLPSYMCIKLYPNIKDQLVNDIVLGKKIDDYCIELYRPLAFVGGHNRGIKSKVLNFLILNNNRLRYVSCFLLKIIRKYNEH